MKSFTLNFGKTFFLGLSVLIALSLSSCRSDEEEELGEFEEIKWKSTDYLTVQEDKEDYCVVSSQGDSFMFVTSNCDHLSLYQIEYESEGEKWNRWETDNYTSFSTDEICDVSVEDKIVEVIIEPNDGHTRKISIQVAQGFAAFGTLNFIQLGRQE